MRKIINLYSRYGEVHKLVRIGENSSHLFLFVPSSDTYRVGYKDKEYKDIKFVDPPGGPFISIGTRLIYYKDKVVTVKSISEDSDNIVIELE